MSAPTIDRPSHELIDGLASSKDERVRYDRVLRARTEILAGRYDNESDVQSMLDQCMDHLLQDATSL